MRTLLTGAGGYIGLHILRELLDHGQRVTAVVRRPEQLGPFARHAQVDVAVSDLEQEAHTDALVSGHDGCVHAALIWGAPGSELQARDVAVSAKLFDAASRAGLSRCIYISSAGVHRPFSGEMHEDDCLRPADLYGATKAAGELFLRAACGTGQMTGVVLRPGPVVGPPAWGAGSNRLYGRIAEMVAAAEAGRRIEVVQGEGRQLSDVRLVARAVRLLTQTEDPHPTYVCVDREILPWDDVARMVVGCSDSSIAVIVRARDARHPVPRFRTDRIEGLLGGPTDAAGALRAQLRFIARDD